MGSVNITTDDLRDIVNYYKELYMPNDTTFHDNGTIRKVYNVLLDMDVNTHVGEEIVMKLQNAGILFREPAKNNEDDVAVATVFRVLTADREYSVQAAESLIRAFQEAGVLFRDLEVDVKMCPNAELEAEVRHDVGRLVDAIERDARDVALRHQAIEWASITAQGSFLAPEMVIDRAEEFIAYVNYGTGWRQGHRIDATDGGFNEKRTNTVVQD